MKEVVRTKNQRSEIEKRIQEALAKKPTASFLHSKGITIDELRKSNAPQPSAAQTAPQVHRVINRRGQHVRQNDPRPATAIRHADLMASPYIDVKPRPCELPEWFRKDDGPVDVSVIVPLYKSSEVIAEQIQSWDLTATPLNVEVVYVNDACPRNSYEVVLERWQRRSGELNGRGVGQLILNEKNGGFGHACNAGAKFARGKYLIFLNADCTVTPGWIEPLYNLMESNSKIGLAGNMQLKVIDGKITIDSAGSEWCWNKGCFEHIGRHIYQGAPLPTPFPLDTAPKDLLEPAEREMVTGCCFIITKELFDFIGGFDPAYRIGYWEDSELCMRVKWEGYQVWFEPRSRIYHAVGHSGSGGHPFMANNRDHFYRKWIYTGILDNWVASKRKFLPVRTIHVKRAAAHGDVLVAASVCAALKKQYPLAKISFETDLPGVLYNNPYIDKVVKNGTPMESQLYYDLDLAYERRPKVHMCKAYADAVCVRPEDCKLFLHEEAYPGLPADYIVMCAGRTAWTGRNWFVERFDAIARQLKESGQTVVVVGNNGDGELPCASMDLRGKTNLYQLAYVIHRAKFYVGIDSFPMWIAQTFNVPGVCFFGCVRPELRIVNPNMDVINAGFLPCIGCHHEQPLPCIGTSSCKVGFTYCEDEVQVDGFMEKIRSGLAKLS